MWINSRYEPGVAIRHLSDANCDPYSLPLTNPVFRSCGRAEELAEIFHANWGQDATTETIYVREREVTAWRRIREIGREIDCRYCCTRSSTRVTIEAREPAYFVHHRISREAM